MSTEKHTSTITPQETASWGFFMLFEVKGRQPYATINNTVRVLSRGEQEDAGHRTHAPALSRRSDSLASIRLQYPASSARIARGHCTLPLHRRPTASGSQSR